MNRIETRTINKKGQITIPKPMSEKAELFETNTAFVTCIGDTIIIKRQHGPYQQTTIKAMVLDILYALSLHDLFDLAVTINNHLTEKSMKGVER